MTGFNFSCLQVNNKNILSLSTLYPTLTHICTPLTPALYRQQQHQMYMGVNTQSEIRKAETSSIPSSRPPKRHWIHFCDVRNWYCCWMWVLTSQGKAIQRVTLKKAAGVWKDFG